MSSTPDKLLYFIRHGQSEANVNDTFQGADSPLTALGRAQAAFVAERLRSVSADVILASPMRRAAETAVAVQNATGYPLVKTELLREYMPPSTLLGVDRLSEAGKTYIREMLEHLYEPAWHYGDEENYFDLHERALAFLAYVTERPERALIAVTHAGFMRVIITAMMTEGKPHPEVAGQLMRFLKPVNTGITICTYHADAVRRNKWRMVAWNDHAHLGETPVDVPE